MSLFKKTTWPDFKTSKGPDKYLEKLKLIRYSENTIHTYCNAFKEFINYYSTRKVEDITEVEIKSYLRYLVEQRCISTSYQNQAINAINFFLRKGSGRSMEGIYSARSIQHIIKAACEKSGIIKNVTMHTLRHSFATHLPEHNTDIRYIQYLLGHAGSRTTEIYTHVTTKGFDQIKSPLDNLDGI